MPKLNGNLLRSVVWDVTVISDVTGDIMSWIGNVDCLSWRYPTKRSDTIDIPTLLQYPSKSPCEYYVLLLELLYDRFNFLFYLLNSFLDTIPAVHDSFALPRNVVRSQHPLLGALVSSFWKRLTSLQQQFIKQAMKDKSNMQENTPIYNQCVIVANDINSRGMQTEVQSLIQCENCYLSEALVKHMVIIIEMFGNDFGVTTAVSAERSQMNEALFKITQWSAMQRWTNAITQDLTNFVTKFTELNAMNKDFKTSAQSRDLKYQDEIKQHMAKIKDLEESEKHLKLKIRTDEEKQSIATRRNKELEIKVALQNVNLENLRKQVQELETCKCIWEAEKERLTTELNKIKQEIEIVHCEYDAQRLEYNFLTEKLKSIKDCKKDQEMELIQIKSTLQQKENALKLQHESYQSQELNQLKTTQKDKIQNLQGLIKQLQTEKLKLEEMTTNQQTSIDQLKQKLHSCKEEKMLLLLYPDLNGPLCQRVVQGTPLQDMQHQLNANRLRIRLLEEQNIKLERTLNKINKLSMAK